MANVLLVEDDANFLHALETMLVLHHHVRMAESGAEALHDVSLHVPDIIVTDVVMPAMGGIRPVRALKAAPRLADIPVILTTGINVPEDLPVQAFLRKPFTAAELAVLINRLLP
jgi:CheY-like chemotaxis protein